MSDIESSEDESPDIDAYVLMAYTKFTEDNFATEAERSQSPVLSLRASAAHDSQSDNSPKSNKVTDIIRFVNYSVLDQDQCICCSPFHLFVTGLE